MAQKRTSVTSSDENLALPQLLIALGALVGIIAVIWLTIVFLSDKEGNKLLQAIIAIIVGSGGVWALFWAANQLISAFPYSIRETIRPYVFVGPAILMLGIFLVYPALNTFWISLTSDIVNIDKTFSDAETKGVPEEFASQDEIIKSMGDKSKRIKFGSYLINSGAFELASVNFLDKDGKPDGSALVYTNNGKIRVREKNPDTGLSEWVMKPAVVLSGFGSQNYSWAFSEPDVLTAYKNNLIWLIVGTSVSVAMGLLIATLVDRIKHEALAKTFVFLPLAISFVGASVIWKFIYAWKPAGKAQIGVFNAIYTFFCRDCGPQSWLRIEDFSINTLFLVLIMIWLQTGFCMVILSGALKGVPGDLLEAARIDGANELEVFFQIIVPVIMGSIITVSTTVFIGILKVFDIVSVMTGGQNKTEVIANRMIKEMLNFQNSGHGAALAVILLIIVIPIMVVNIRNLRTQGINQ